MRLLATIAVIAATAVGLAGQPVVFKLQVPELGDQVFDADVVEVPGPMPQSLVIRVLNPVAADVDYGKILTKLNGEGAGYITSVSASVDGKVARMDLKLREGMKLTPGTNTIEVQAINKHGRKFYRNFLIKTREESRNEYFTYEVKRVPGDTTGGPDISIAGPEGPITLGSRERAKRVAIKGHVSSVLPLTALHVAGSEIPLPPDKNTFDFERAVETPVAASSLVIEAVDQAGNHTAVTIPVERQGTGRPLKIEGDRYALLIGVSEYSAKPPLARLASASLDAQDFAMALRDQAGFKRENIDVLTDAGATSAQIHSALRNFTARAGPDDLLIVFLAGYGLHDPLDPSQIYLAGSDTQLGHVPDTALSIDELKATLSSNVRSRQALFLFDVDHPVTGDWAARTNNLINEYLLRLFPGDPGKAVMVGSSVGENSVDTGAGGLFARHLIEAAKGQADANKDGVTTVREWFLQVSRAVRTESHGAQNPRFTLQQAEKPVFAQAK
jgi:hypothetical protein